MIGAASQSCIVGMLNATKYMKLQQMALRLQTRCIETVSQDTLKTPLKCSDIALKFLWARPLLPKRLQTGSQIELELFWECLETKSQRKCFASQTDLELF